MNAKDHHRVIAALDQLGEQVIATIQKFEATGMTSIMKDDYVALHVLEARINEMRLEHAQAAQSSPHGGC